MRQGNWIRTSDLHVPNVARYRATLYPEKLKEHEKSVYKINKSYGYGQSYLFTEIYFLQHVLNLLFFAQRNGDLGVVNGYQIGFVAFYVFLDVA